MTPKEVYELSLNKYSEFEKKKDYYESVIAKDKYSSYCYAKNVLKGRFEKGEKAIAINSYYSCWYAKNVLKGRFELCEYVLIKYSLTRYYHEWIKKRPNELAFCFKFI